MIPKIIHFCWFSNPEDYPEDVKNCIESWKRIMPDYEIVRWSNENFDFNINTYVKEAFDEGKYAFASDYVRLWALYNYGGIYLDSDIEIIKSFDSLLKNKAFTGLEDTGRVAAWIFGSEKGNPIFKEFMDYYNGRHFVQPDGMYDLTPNPVPITNTLVKHGLKLDEDVIQNLDDITVYSTQYFCPFNPYRGGDDRFTEYTYANHHFNGSWLTNKSKREEAYLRKEQKYQSMFGEKWGKKIHANLHRISHMGMFAYIKWRMENKY